MPVIIRYEHPGRWEEYKEQVDQILKEADLENGYQEFGSQFPPMIFVPSGLGEHSEARFKLDQLQGVEVREMDG